MSFDFTEFTEKELQILKIRFGLFVKPICTLEEAGKKLKITRIRAGQIEATAFRKWIRFFCPTSLRQFIISLEKKDIVCWEKKNEARRTGVMSLDFPVGYLNLTRRVWHCLIGDEINTVGKLISKSDRDLGKIPNLGKKSIQEIKNQLEKYGLKLHNEE